MLYWFRWENITTAAGSTYLAGWVGIILVGYVGAVWFADDLRTGVNKQIAVLKTSYAGGCDDSDSCFVWLVF